MKKFILIILSFIGFSTQVMAQENLRIMESLSMYSHILKQEIKYSVILPEDYYNEKSAYPVVYMLHGLGDDETAWLEFGRVSQFYHAEISHKAVVPMIFIMPQGFRTYYVNDYLGTFRYQDMFIRELVPYIDSVYRTIPDSRHRGLTGYSMGGFGALVLHLQHPDIFGSSVPLSISIRTDEQYMKEYAPEWDQQWGRLFGAVGTEGPERITEYYKQNNPFYIIPNIPSSDYSKYRIYVDNGDKEQTLCRSNEELHILMRDHGFPHEFRVREGGHSFSYWCSALPNGLHFLSDAFQGKPYRGDIKEADDDVSVVKPSQALSLQIGNDQVLAFVPGDFHQTSRLYPVLFVTENIGATMLNSIISAVDRAVEANVSGPVVVMAMPDKLFNELPSILPQLESEFRLRDDYHFRSVLGFRETAAQVCDLVLNRMQFSSCVLVDSYLQKDAVVKMMEEMPHDALKKTPLFIIAPDKGNFYEGNGNLHMLLRDKEIKHEYRIVEEVGDLEEIIHFISENYHR